MLGLPTRLRPYLDGAREAARRAGAPVVRSLGDETFLCGDALVAAPPGAGHVSLPAGTWADWWTGAIVHGPVRAPAHAPPGQPVLYARVNAAIPLRPERAPFDRLTLRVYCGPGEAVTRDAAGRTVTVDRRRIHVSAPSDASAARMLDLELFGTAAAGVRVNGDERAFDDASGAVVVELDAGASAVEVLMPA